MSTVQTNRVQHSSGTGNNIILSADGDTQVNSLNSGQLAGFRNQLINGNMAISQRGTSFDYAASSTYQNSYSLDRWSIEWQQNVAATVEQDKKMTADAPADYSYALRANVTASGGGSNAVFLISQRIENIETFAGQEVTLSFTAKSPNSLKIGVELWQNPGTGTPNYGAIKQLVTTDNSYTRYTVTGTLPYPTANNANSYLGVGFWLVSGSNNDNRSSSIGFQTGEIDISNVQLEPGPVATPFEHRPIGTELAMCQRYFYRTSTKHAIWTGMTVPSKSYSVSADYPVQMRATPTIDNITSATRDDFYSPTLNVANNSSATFVAQSSADSDGNYYWVGFDADADL